MYVDFMIKNSLQPDAMQISLLKTLKLSALINISALMQIKDSALTFLSKKCIKRKKKKKQSFMSTATVELVLCE